MDTAQEGPNRVTPAAPTESPSKSTSETDEKPASLKNVNEKSLSVKIEEMAPPDVPQVAASSNPPSNIKDGLQTINGFNSNAAYTSNIYAPQAHPVYYTGYGEWDEYQQHLNPEVMDLRSSGIYSDNMPLMFPTSFGYNPHVPYGPYSPVTTPLPSSGGDPQLYATQQFPFSGPYYQHPLPPNLVYPGSPSPQLQSDPSMTTSKHHGRNSSTESSGNPGFYDTRHGFDGFGPGSLWPDWSKSLDTHISFSPVASPQPISTQGAFGHGSTPFASGLQRYSHGYGSSVSSQDREYFHAGVHRQNPNFGVNIGTSFHSWVPLEKGRRREKDNMSLCTCADTNDFLSEQTRGPRATRTKNSAEEPNSSDGKNACGTVVDGQLYNKHEFMTEYDHAKFFIIKSYTEDNVHKSIKYGVWASTPNGNRKLDGAYREAKENGDGYPIFLFFSVNSSAQFCGVAEMTGPVDFDKSVDYWQQDKWSGQFPVKWHIIKDVPNSVFRHIILENNDNKPVTNSRDTQEVKLEQGLEMLRLFKKHESVMSILDDFDFYEERQKAMQERKAFQKQQQSGSTVTAFPMIGGIEHPHQPSMSGNQMNQLTKSFAEIIIENKPTAKGSPPAANIGDVSKPAAKQSS